MAKGSNTFGGTIKLEGEQEYRKALSNINSSLRVVASEMSKVSAEYGKNDKSTEALTSKNEVLNKKLQEQEKQVELLRNALDHASTSENANQKNIDSWQVSLNKAEAELTKTKKEIDSNNQALEENSKGSKESSKGIKEFGDNSEEASKSVLKLGDIIKANLLLDDNNNISVIDFSAFNYLPRIVEVTALLLGLCLTDERETTINKMNQFLRYYHNLIPLSDLEIEYLPLLLKSLASMYIIQTSFIVSESLDYVENEYWLLEGRKYLDMDINKKDLQFIKKM